MASQWWFLAASVAPICTGMVGTDGACTVPQVPGPVAARLLRVLAPDRLLVAAYPWPGMEMVVTVRIRPDIPSPPADPARAEQDRLILEARLRLMPPPLWLYDIEPTADGLRARIILVADAPVTQGWR